ncbi:TIGR02688 family protein [Desulfofundulus thermosubterraneus DSM 16057]|uniref:TIGR02688 family protein n=1 Tax=Desulfofundulus thermosubterraneus DSM 16057 TaxID=1121432 RepID=A0A1M6E921_9FIRM|nr:TIGR02688 family protein [Desulfofundulus thermosubterraneus DSM 16057]
MDVKTGEGLFSLPDLGFPGRKYEAMIADHVLREKKDVLFASSETWGIVELEWRMERILGRQEEGRVFLIDFKPFRPYRVDLEFYQEARKEFNLEEWIDILLMAVDYNPAGFLSNEEKLTMLSRLLPFVEKRVNIIELAPKGTGKSYLFSQISKYGWLVSGGSISRARLFYDLSRRSTGLVSRYDYVALDEIQSISFPDEEEVRGALKGYLESGEYRVGDYRGVGEAGFVLLGILVKIT